MTLTVDPWLTTEEAAELVHNHPETIRQACRRGELKAAKRGRNWRIRRSSIETWVEGVPA